MIKKFGLLFSSGLLKITLVSLALAAAGWATFGSPDAIKQGAAENGLYENIITNILEDAKQNAGGQDTQLPVDRPEIEQAAKDAVSSEELKKNGETVIDSFYGWLQGTTQQPEFSLDFNEAKNRFATNVADYAQSRYEGLPECTLEQLQSLTPDVDPLTVECRAPNISGSVVRERVLQSILSSNEFSQDASFTSNDLPKDENGNTFTEVYSGAPDTYKLLGSLPWILGLLSIILGLGVLLLSENKRKGLRSIGVSLLGTGLFLAIGAWIISLVFKYMNSQVRDPFQLSITGIMKTLVDTYNGTVLKYAAAYVLLGAVILLSMWYQRRQQKSTQTITP